MSVREVDWMIRIVKWRGWISEQCYIYNYICKHVPIAHILIIVIPVQNVFLFFSVQGLRPIHYAVWQRYAEAVRLLLVRGCDVNSTDDCGYSPLHLAAEHGYTEMMKVSGVD